MDRRNFLRRAGALSLPFIAGIPGVKAAGSSILTSLLPPSSDKVLVLVQLAGGNDGLNTLIPTDQLGELQSIRSNIYMPPSSLKPLTLSLSMHSRMSGMQQMFNTGTLSIVQSVGYPNQNRSHFRSTDIWTTASDATEELSTGWLGRHLEVNYPGYPVGYPVPGVDEDPAAITMGSVANATCQGTITNLSQTVTNPNAPGFLAPGGNTTLPNDNYGDELGFLRVSIQQTFEYGNRIQQAASSGSSSTGLYPGGNLSTQLSNVVKLISGGLGTQVYVVTLGGFDNHSGQTTGNNTSGTHADLLGELSDNLLAFQQDLANAGLADRVLGMTFSEFGRRMRSNGSRGTDHGTAAPLFVFGNCASGTILGDNVNIDTGIDQYEGVPMQYDFRDIYGSILVDWFDVNEADVRNLLYPDFMYLPVASGCGSSLPVDLVEFLATGQDKHIDLTWTTSREDDNRGFEVERSDDGRNFRRVGYLRAQAPEGDGQRNYELADRNVGPGILYYYRLKQLDNDGDFQYSPIRTARLSGGALGKWSFGHAFPNPVIDETSVQVYAPTDGRVTYSLYNAAGQRMLENSEVVYGRRDNRITIRVGRVPAGIYTLRLTGADGKYANRKLVVRK